MMEKVRRERDMMGTEDPKMEHQVVSSMVKVFEFSKATELCLTKDMLNFLAPKG